MITISPISRQHSYYSVKKNSVQNSVSKKNYYSLSFKGSERLNYSPYWKAALKRMWKNIDTLIAAAAGAVITDTVAFADKKDKPLTQDDKIYLMEGSKNYPISYPLDKTAIINKVKGYERINDHNLLQAYLINPELTESLIMESIKDETVAQNGTVILRLVETAEQNKKAFNELKKELKWMSANQTDNPSMIDYFITQCKENPKEFNLFKRKTNYVIFDIEEIGYIMYIKDNAPELYKNGNRSRKQYGESRTNWMPEQLIAIYELKQKYPDVVNELFKDRYVDYSDTDRLIEITPYWKEYKESIQRLLQLSQEENNGFPNFIFDIVNVAKLHKAEPEKVERTMFTYYTDEPEIITALKDLETKNGKKYRDEIKSHMNELTRIILPGQSNHQLEIDNFINYVTNAIKWEPLLNPLIDKIRNNSEQSMIRYNFISKVEGMNTDVVSKILAAGEHPQTVDELLLLAEKYNDGAPTNAQVQEPPTRAHGGIKIRITSKKNRL